MPCLCVGGEQGAFAYVTEEELMGPGLWINKRAARRILGG